MLYHTRFVPINISNLIVPPNYVKTHVRLTKIYLMRFLKI